MKFPLLSLSFAFIISVGQAQINMLRYNDNFSALKNDTLKDGLEKLKYIKLSEHATISFGGELREQFQYFDNLNFGDVPPGTKSTAVTQLWHRLLLHSNIELGPKARIFVQLNSTFRFFNPNPVTPEIDENRLSIHQAFLDYSFSKKWMIRAGRQELVYGNNRLLSFREGPNTRLTFDAAIVKYSSAKTSIDFFAVTPVISRQYVFDDKSFEDALLGVYGTTRIIPQKLLLDYYFINFKSERRRYNFVAGKEVRQIFGFRAFSKNPRLNYELEGTYQTGTFNDLAIKAYALSGDLSYNLSKRYNLIMGVAGNYITGDRDRQDGELNTYNFLFSKPQYGLAAPIGSSNIENINPYLRFSPTKKLSVYTAVYFMRRESTEDGTYSPGADQVRPASPKLFVSTEKGIGTQYALETNYVLNKNISLAADAAWFKAGSYVKETGKGEDITYISFRAAFKF